MTTGNSLISGMDDTMRFIFLEKDGLSGEYIDILGYLWMLIMNIHSQGGHFPISANKSSEPAYDFQQIRVEAELESDDALIKLIDLIVDCLKDSSSELIEMESWYNLIRNYTYIVARIQEDYYKLAEETIYDIVNKLKEIVENNPSLIHRGDTFDNHVV